MILKNSELEKVLAMPQAFAQKVIKYDPPQPVIGESGKITYQDHEIVNVLVFKTEAAKTGYVKLVEPRDEELKRQYNKLLKKLGGKNV